MTIPKLPAADIRVRLILATLLVLVVAVVGCSSDAEPTPVDMDDYVLIDGPPPFPVIFEGKFTVDGEPGPAGSTIYAMFIHGGSPRSTSQTEGLYQQVILGPISVTDLEHGEITFYLGTRDGDHVKADQTWTWDPVNHPTNQVLDLSFPRLPES